MIFKAKDPISDQLGELELALQQPLPYRDRRRLEKELAQRRAGLEGEEEAACRFNSKRFAGRLLCRTCQPSASGVVTTAVPV
jgi:hypothetical protein